MRSRPPCGRSRCPADGCWAAGRRKSEQRTSLPPICALCPYLSLEPDPLQLVLRETLLGLAVELGGACVRAQFVQALGQYARVKEQNLYIRLLSRSRAYLAARLCRASAR